MFDISIKPLLQGAALILSVVNGFILFRNYMRDKPKLIVSPVHPEIYQWWIRLKDIEVEGKTVRRYAFLAYFGVANQGLRDVAVNGWRLYITNRLGLIQIWHKKKELKPYNLPEAHFVISDEHLKVVRAFGQKSQSFDASSTMVKSGDSISGMACWMYSVQGDERWNPKADKHGRISAVLKIKDVFDGSSQCKIIFREWTLEKLKEASPNIGDYLERSEYL